MDDDTVDLQLQIWGYAVTGDVTEISAAIAEGATWLEVFDRRQQDIVNSVIHVDGRVMLVPAWWCLRWLSIPQREEATELLHRQARAGRRVL